MLAPQWPSSFNSVHYVEKAGGSTFEIQMAHGKITSFSFCFLVILGFVFLFSSNSSKLANENCVIRQIWILTRIFNKSHILPEIYENHSSPDWGLWSNPALFRVTHLRTARIEYWYDAIRNDMTRHDMPTMQYIHVRQSLHSTYDLRFVLYFLGEYSMVRYDMTRYEQWVIGLQ
jgi:hypothetical protein